IIAFKHGFHPNRIIDFLESQNIYVNFRENDSQIRIGVALFNHQDDINHFLETLTHYQKKGLA
ncbi:MAG: hypothetical protein AAF490_22565, partial [Chloroflexota bacterium]